MNSSILGAFLANPSVFVLKLFVEALPGAAIAYAIMWWILRPKDGRKVLVPFFRHALGVFVSVAGGALFRVIAMATFAGRGAFETASETGASAFYFLMVPAVAAAGYIVWLKRQLSNPSSSPTASDEGNVGYAKALAEIEEGRLEKGVWARAFADAGGEVEKAKALYIKARAGALKNDKVWQATQPSAPDDASAKGTTSASSWSVTDDIRMVHPSVKVGAVLVLLLLFGSLVLPEFRKGLWGAEGRHTTDAREGTSKMEQASPKSQDWLEKGSTIVPKKEDWLENMSTPVGEPLSRNNTGHFDPGTARAVGGTSGEFDPSTARPVERTPAQAPNTYYKCASPSGVVYQSTPCGMKTN